MPERKKTSLEAELTRLRSENRRLQKENQELRLELGPPVGDVAPAAKDTGQVDNVTNQSSTDQKIRLFRSLFRGREDVYPVRWENQNGRAGYSPACTERVGHAELLAEKLERFAKNVIILRGGRSQKKAGEALDQLAAVPEDQERLIIATGRYIGEGFDDARLDTLFLTMPISWKGTLQQYVGRLHRRYRGKQEVCVYDYVDQNLFVFRKMYERRLRGCRAIGYDVASNVECARKQPLQ